MKESYLPSNNGKILQLIPSFIENMTPSSRRIYQFILKNADNVSRLSIADLSQFVGVGEATIIRFCRSLGFKGFQDFKIALAVEVSSPQKDESIIDSTISQHDDTGLIGRKLADGIRNVLEESLTLLDFTAIENAAKLIQSAKKIHFFGVGSSGLTAEDAKNKFMRIGFNVDAQTNNHFMYMNASLMGKNDLVFGISHSGNSGETIKALSIAKSNKATTIALTHDPLSAIIHHSDLILLNGNHQGQMQGDSIGTKIAQLYVLDLLYILVVKENISAALAKKQLTTQALTD